MKKEFRLLVVGKTGTGKSELCNVILGKKVFSTGPWMESETSKCQYDFHDWGKRSIEIFDTPGLFGTETLREDLEMMVMRSVAGMNPGPHAVLFVHKVDDRFTPQDAATFTEIKRYFGTNVTNRTIVVFTHADVLMDKKISQRDYMARITKEFKQVLAECGHRYVFFDNTAFNPQPQINALLEEVRGIVSSYGGRCYNGGPLFNIIKEKMDQEASRRMAASERDASKWGIMPDEIAQAPDELKNSKSVKAIQKWVEREMKKEIANDTSSGVLQAMAEAAKYILIGLALVVIPPLGFLALVSSKNNDDKKG